MKKLLPILLSVSGCLVFLLQGCLKDSYERTYTYSFYEPIYKTPAEVRANIKSAPAQRIERPGKIYIRGNYIFLNEVDKGIHVIDNSDPSQPKTISFINIPGNMDIAVKGNTLYADLYTDFVAIDISDPLNVKLKKTIDNIFPYRSFGGYYRGDSSKIIVEWVKKDTTIREKHKVDEWLGRGGIFFSLSAAQSLDMGGGGKAVSSSPYGAGGSLSRFAIANERLYTVGSSNLDVFNISNANDPARGAKKQLGWNIETIYPFRDKLFIGSQTGMFVYNINNPDNPVQEGQFNHVRTCDPVIADDSYAYVTLRSGTTCQGFTNQLDVLNLSNLSNPTLVKTYAMTNPHGLSKDGNVLFICDAGDGLKIFDAANPSNLTLIKKIAGNNPIDVIAHNGIALVVAKDGLYQYDYSDLSNIRLRSRIGLSN